MTERKTENLRCRNCKGTGVVRSRIMYYVNGEQYIQQPILITCPYCEGMGSFPIPIGEKSEVE